ncbi:MAG TPA: RNA 2',3'-cyclic phosphodiesterase [Bryobacteraceae bacterium]|jgi:2'-5' RNA ligase|nr:RNA 2',3'-cyclic phosphodiesterase [Bryobacteraceae bacterium]
MRLFTAIDLPKEMLEKLGTFLARLSSFGKLRWTAVENLHITTKFIGEWPEGRLEEIKSALRGVSQTEAIRISVRSVGWFPDSRRPHVFWAGVDGGVPLIKLAGATEQAVAALGVPVDARAYSPHLTLARVKYAVPLDDLRTAAGDPDFGAFEAASFFLYLSSNGKYSKLAEFPLNS